MFRYLLSLIVSILGVKIFLYSGNREDLIPINECKILSINDHWITFNFYKKVQINTIVRGYWISKEEYTYYVIEAVFSESFSDNYKHYNEVKYYIDFKNQYLYNQDVVLSILLDKFTQYLEHEIDKK